MEFEGLKVTGDPGSNNEKKEEKANEVLQKSDAEASYLYTTDYAMKILEAVRNKDEEVEEIVYGVYNNRNKSLFVRMNDFLIDHSGVKLKEKAYFFHLLGVMVDAGVPVVQAVRSLANHTDNERFRRVLNTVAYNCDHGATLTDAMTRFDDVFDEVELGVVRAGESSGRLNLMLKKLADQLEKRHQLNSRLWGAAAYPIVVVVVLVGVALAMLVWVLPTLLSLFQESGISNESLPFSTRMLIGVQSFFVSFWWAVILFLAAAYGAFSSYISTDKGSLNWDFKKLKFPLLGNLVRKIYVLRFVGMLGLLIESGLPVIKALEISANAIANRVYKLKAQESIEKVRVGSKISQSLGDSHFLFPHEVIEVLRVGEASANLADISQKLAVQYQREVDNSLKKLTSIFEPVMILFVALFVAILALAVMAPIFNLSSVVGV